LTPQSSVNVISRAIVPRGTEATIDRCQNESVSPWRFQHVDQDVFRRCGGDGVGVGELAGFGPDLSAALATPRRVG